MGTTADGLIPLLGFGTYQLSGDNAVAMVEHALRVGYRHIDTAQMYGNEAEVGHGILASGLPRAHVFLTTKIWPDNFAPQDLTQAVNQSLQQLGTDYLDLILLHWPNPNVPLEDTLSALMAAQQAGKTRHIGVSNFTIDLMRQAVAICGPGTLINNQIEYHPFLWQDRVIQAAHELDLSVTAYRPIAKGKVFRNDTLLGMAQTHNKTAAQVTLRWIIQQGIVAIPRSSSPQHVSENFNIFDFELSEAEMQAIHSIPGDQRLVSPDALAPRWDAPEPITA
ncbi:hypothetical protein C7271_07520 [filamentous cyanobacterium CCP5]|nr:hypothetical protein C7271_07520 [filamentous cyanobacterium CCP5]